MTSNCVWIKNKNFSFDCMFLVDELSLKLLNYIVTILHVVKLHLNWKKKIFLFHCMFLEAKLSLKLKNVVLILHVIKLRLNWKIRVFIACFWSWTETEVKLYCLNFACRQTARELKIKNFVISLHISEAKLSLKFNYISFKFCMSSNDVWIEKKFFIACF